MIILLVFLVHPLVFVIDVEILSSINTHRLEPLNHLFNETNVSHYFPPPPLPALCTLRLAVPISVAFTLAANRSVHNDSAALSNEGFTLHNINAFPAPDRLSPLLAINA